MGHKISSPRRDLIFAVVDMNGDVVSWHHTREAAQRAIDVEWQRFRRRYPQDWSGTTPYLPRSIVCCKDGAKYIERPGDHSTSWV